MAQPKKKKPREPRDEPAQAGAEPGGYYTTYVDHAVLPGNNRIIGSTFAGNGRDIVITNADGTEIDALPNAAISLQGAVAHLHFSGWTNRPHGIAGGQIGTLSGDLEHHPDAADRPAPTSGYSAGGVSCRCQCGFLAYRFTVKCPKCHRDLRGKHRPQPD